MTNNKELRTADPSIPEETGSTRHIEFDLKGTGLSYVTADNLAILPLNDTVHVSALATTMGYFLDEVISIEPVEGNNDFKHAFPSPCSVREILTSYLDIQGAVKYSTVKHLVPYVVDDEERKWIQRLISKENRGNFKTFVEEGGKSLCELLTNELSSCRIPLADFLHIAPFIQPRYYTISSSSSVYPNNVHITVSLTEYELKSGRKFTGLTSGYLKNLDPLSTKEKLETPYCRIFIRASSFRLPASISTPIIMIGPGTGLAPMRALLQERKYLRDLVGSSMPLGENILYFGCKYASVDYIYRDELEQFRKDGVLTQLHTAFSRDGPKKVYVQHLLAQHAADLLELLDVDKKSKSSSAGAYVYVCGATSMGNDVMAAFVSMLQEHKKMSKTDATNYIKELQDCGRYVQELWSS